MKMILASGSPRRRELLAGLGLRFTVRPTDADETLPDGLPPDEAVKLLASRKAEAAARAIAGEQREDTLILAADTVVACDGRILGKPSDPADARAMLAALSGRTHTVWTGIAAVLSGRLVRDAVRTDVRFRALSDREIDAYVATGEPLDKAGAYGIQGRGALLVEGIDGDYFNVVGLPLCRLSQLLRGQFGVTLTDL